MKDEHSTSEGMATMKDEHSPNEGMATMKDEHSPNEGMAPDEGNVIITWPLSRDASKFDDDDDDLDTDEVEEDEVEGEGEDEAAPLLDQYGRPYTIVKSLDPDGRPMTVECHTAADGSPYTIENRVTEDGHPHSIQYPGEWKGKAWRFDPEKLPKWKQEQIGQDFLELYMDFMRKLEKDPVRKAEFEERVKEIRKKYKKK